MAGYVLRDTSLGRKYIEQSFEFVLIMAVSKIIYDILRTEESFGINILSGRTFWNTDGEQMMCENEFGQMDQYANLINECSPPVRQEESKTKSPEEPDTNRRVPYTDDENVQLCKGILQYGREWTKILDHGKHIFHPSRTRDSLRMRANTVAFKKKYDEFMDNMQ